MGTPTGVSNQSNYQQFSNSQSNGNSSNNSHKTSVGRAGTIGPSAGAALVAQHQQNLLTQQDNFFSAPNTPNNASGNLTGGGIVTSTNQSPRSASSCTNTGGIEEIKPRSLRFTWSMKTTSSLAPDDIMKYILLLKNLKNFNK